MQLHQSQAEQERLKEQLDAMTLQRDELQLKLDMANRQDFAHARRAANEAVVELAKARETHIREKWVQTSHDRILELSHSIRCNLEEDGANVIHRTHFFQTLYTIAQKILIRNFEIRSRFMTRRADPESRGRM